MTDQTNDRPMGSTDDDLDTDRDDALEDDRAGGWAGVPEALEDPIAGDETPGSQGEIEAGSEGDFGDRGS
jgi:hypothetical protein